MTNPPNTEGLTAEQIKTLRFIAEHPLVIEEDSDNFYSADYLNVCGFVDVADGAWRINHAGRVVLATLDKAIDTERERVLAEIDAAASRLVNPRKDFTWSVAKDPQSLGECFEVWHTNPPQADDGFADAATFTEALLGENNQEGEG